MKELHRVESYLRRIGDDNRHGTFNESKAVSKESMYFSNRLKI